MLLLVYALVFVVYSFRYGREARLIPLLVALTTLALVILVLIHDHRPLAFLQRMDIDLTSKYRTQSISAPQDSRPSITSLVYIACWIFGFFIAVLIIGFHFSIPLFTLVYLKIKGKVSWFKAASSAAVLGAAAYAVFELIMGFRLFQGWLFGEILPPL
jgi:hypothetical protein